MGENDFIGLDFPDKLDNVVDYDNQMAFDCFVGISLVEAFGDSKKKLKAKHLIIILPSQMQLII